MQVNRQKLLDAALRVFAESGFRGATTKRIAEAAGVNEVTLFRHFKSKTALINEAAQLYARRRTEAALPEDPEDPLEELTAWCTSQLTFLRNTRSLIRKCMAELEEHPQMAACMRHGPDLAQLQLGTYVSRLVVQRNLSLGPDEVRVACTMLHGALFSDAMGRDMMPDRFPRPLRRAGAQYARSFLRLLGPDLFADHGNGRQPAANGAPRRRGSRSRGT
ncbi:MAG TPA: helix-turn-helix domain-containing protein [Gemmatimonadaceae bacterium]